MSVDTAIARIGELRSFEQAIMPTPAARTAPAAPTKFSGTLQHATAGRFGAEIAAAARRHHVDPALITAVIDHESGFDPDATSSSGAMGLMQLMPQTAAGLGVSDPYDPAANIEGGTAYLASLLRTFHGNTELALAGYSAGAAAVERYHGVPPYAETQKAVPEILAIYHRLGGTQ